MKTKILFLSIFLFAVSAAHGQIITSVAGTGSSCGWLDSVAATVARMTSPADVAIDPAGNLYMTDRNNVLIRKVSATTGKITRITGISPTPGYTGDGGPATAATLFDPYGIASDASGNIYFTDGGTCVRKISTSGIITTVAGTPGITGYNGDSMPATAAQFKGASFIAFDAAGNMYVSDGYNHRVRKISTAGIITTIAGTGIEGTSGDNGPATAANLDEPAGIAIDAAGNIYIGDQDSAHCVRKINAAGIITTFAEHQGYQAVAEMMGRPQQHRWANPQE